MTTQFAELLEWSRKCDQLAELCRQDALWLAEERARLKPYMTLEQIVDASEWAIDEAARIGQAGNIGRTRTLFDRRWYQIQIEQSIEKLTAKQLSQVIDMIAILPKEQV